MAKEEKPTAAKPAPKPLATNIHFALAAIMMDINAIPKDQQNQQQGFNFRGIDDFYNALHPIFAAHGVVTVPEVLESTFDKWANAKGNTVFCARVKVKYTFLATDGTFVPAVGNGEAYDFGDKALNKAMSMAHKYVLAQMFQIPTAQPDGDAYTYDQTVDPKANPYAGKSLLALEVMRDEIFKAEGKVPHELLGLIAELKADAQDKATPAATTPAGAPTQGAQAAPEKGNAPPKNGEAKKAAAAEKKAAKPTPPPIPPAGAPATPPAGDLAPGAVGAEPAEDGFGEEEKPQPQEQVPADANASLAFEIKETALKHKDYVGRKLGQLSREEIDKLVESWVNKFADQIAQNKDKAELRDHILVVKAAWDAAPQK